MYIVETKTKFSEAILYIQIYEMDHNGKLPTPKEIAEEMNVSRSTAAEALHEVKSMREGLLGPVKLTKAQEYHIETRLKLLSKKLENEFNNRVRIAMLEQNKEYRTGLEKLQKEARDKFESYTALINKHKPIFTEDQFRIIIACLHPDNSASKEKREIAFREFQAMKLQLTGKK